MMADNEHLKYRKHREFLKAENKPEDIEKTSAAESKVKAERSINDEITDAELKLSDINQLIGASFKTMDILHDNSKLDQQQQFPFTDYESSYFVLQSILNDGIKTCHGLIHKLTQKVGELEIKRNHYSSSSSNTSDPKMLEKVEREIVDLKQKKTNYLVKVPLLKAQLKYVVEKYGGYVKDKITNN